MTAQKAVDERPCMDLGLARKIIAGGHKELKLAEKAVKRLSELGADVLPHQEQLRHIEAAERMANSLLKEAERKEKDK